jgi:hypothetical protein
MDNKYTGEVDIKLWGKEYTLQFDWAAIAKLKSVYPQDDIITKLRSCTDPMLTAKVLAIGLNKNHPEITAEEIYNRSPAIIPIILQIDLALKYAFIGIEEIRTNEKDKKKVKKLILTTLKKLLK